MAEKLAKRVSECVKKEESAFEEKNKKMFETFFSKYDTNKDGKLSIVEVKLMMKECLTYHQKNIDDITDVLIEASAKIAVDVAKNGDFPAALLPRFESDVKKMMYSNKPKAKKKLTRITNNYLKDSDDLAKQLFERMDTDHDGEVQRAEFLENYQMAFSETINFVKLYSDVVKVSMTLQTP